MSWDVARIFHLWSRSYVGLLSLLTTFSACSRCETHDDETLIRALIEGAEKSAEKHAVGEIMDLTTDDLIVLPGEKDRSSVKRTLFVAFRFYDKFDIVYPRPTVNVDKSRVFAEAVIHFVILRSGIERPALAELYEDPDAFIEQASKMADLYQLAIWLKKTDGDWRVRKAHLKGGARLIPGI